jgi:hypothetical protein
MRKNTSPKALKQGKNAISARVYRRVAVLWIIPEPTSKINK